MGTIQILAVVALAIIGFYIYCFFKVIEFVVIAVNLYKEMIENQKATINLLGKIRDEIEKQKQITT